MLNLVVAFTVGALLAAGLWVAMAPVFAHQSLVRTNYRGRSLATSGGLVVVLVVVLVVAVVGFESVARLELVPIDAQLGWSSMLVAALGFGFLGFVDDLLGDSSAQGFRGHLLAMARGRLTTGGLKLVGGGVVAVVAVMMLRPYVGNVRWLLIDALVVALAANLANLFDRAPGRVTKFAGVGTVALVLVAPLEWQATANVEIPPVATLVVIGAAFGLLWPELRERMMLGDAGANVVGAALGLGVVGAVGQASRLLVLVALVALNLASEKVSFSRVIATTPGLRQLDQLGRMTE